MDGGHRLALIGTARGWLLGLLVVIMVGLLLVSLAYQTRPTLALIIGDERLDKGVIRDFHARERRENGPPGREATAPPEEYLFRWTRGNSSIALPGWGPGAYRLTIEAAAPLNPNPLLAVRMNGELVEQTRLSGEFARQIYTLPDSMTAGGDLILSLESPTFIPSPRDARRLGVAVHSVTLEPLSAGLVTPPASALQAILGLALLAYSGLLIAGWGWRAAALGALLPVLGLAIGLVIDRVFVAPILGQLIRAAGLAILSLVLMRLGLAGLTRWWPGRRAQPILAPTERSWLLTIVAATLLIRLVATAHPQMDIIDIGFHVNRLSDVQRGNLFLRIASAEWGGRETTYSPAVYLAMWPFSLILADKHQLIRTFTACLETSRLLLVFALARWISGQGRTALWATLLAASLPLAVVVFSWGITSNLFGEWWATALLLALAVGWRRLAQPLVAGVVILVATLALLAHPGDLLLIGVTLSLLVTGVTLGWLRARRGALAAREPLALPERESRAASEPAGRGGWSWPAPALIMIVLLAFGLAFGLFYRVDAAMMVGQGLTTIQQRLTGQPSQANQPPRWRVSGSVDDKSLGLGARYVTDRSELPWQGLIGYAREAWAYYWGWPFLAAGLGWWVVRDRPRAQPLRGLSIAWLAAAGLFALTGLLINLYVRYMLFLLPLVSVLAAVGLDWLARRYRWGLWLASVGLTGTVAGGLWLWYQRIVYFFH